MGQRYLVDTNTIIDYLENKLPKKSTDLIDSIPINFSIISRIELLAWPKSSINQIEIINAFIDASTVFNLTEDVIIESIRIRRNYRVKLPDAIIAATSLVNDFTLLTRNVRDFQNIESLICTDPYLL